MDREEGNPLKVLGV